MCKACLAAVEAPAPDRSFLPVMSSRWSSVRSNLLKRAVAGLFPATAKLLEEHNMIGSFLLAGGRTVGIGIGSGGDGGSGRDMNSSGATHSLLVELGGVEVLHGEACRRGGGGSVSRAVRRLGRDGRLLADPVVDIRDRDRMEIGNRALTRGHHSRTHLYLDHGISLGGHRRGGGELARALGERP